MAEDLKKDENQAEKPLDKKLEIIRRRINRLKKMTRRSA